PPALVSSVNLSDERPMARLRRAPARPHQFPPFSDTTPRRRNGIVRRMGSSIVTVPLARYSKLPRARIERSAPPTASYRNWIGTSTVALSRAPTVNSVAYAPSAKSYHCSPSPEESSTSRSYVTPDAVIPNRFGFVTCSWAYRTPPWRPSPPSRTPARRTSGSRRPGRQLAAKRASNDVAYTIPRFSLTPTYSFSRSGFRPSPPDPPSMARRRLSSHHARRSAIRFSKPNSLGS